MKKVLMVLSMLVATQSAQASDFNLYGGLGFGLNNAKGATSEEDKNGYSLQTKVLGSWEHDLGFIDLGLGYQIMTLDSANVKITTKSVTGEVEYRYKLSDTWSVGPNLRLISGTDNTNSEVIGETTTANTLNLKAAYQTALGDNPFRVEFGAGSTMGLERAMTNVMVGVQFAIPFSKTKTVSKSKVAAKSNVEVADLTLDLKIANVKFATDKFTLQPNDDAKLRKLGKFLAENNSQWSRIKISGHTDITGDATYNKALSQDRADTVMKTFTVVGVDETKMTAHGFGSSRPEDAKNDSDAWAKNRRTEIEFFGLTNRAEFNKKLMEILK